MLYFVNSFGLINSHLIFTMSCETFSDVIPNHTTDSLKLHHENDMKINWQNVQ